MGSSDPDGSVRACALCGHPRVEPYADLGGLIVARCARCRCGQVVGADLLDIEHLDEASGRYERELRPDKAQACLRLLEQAVGGLTPGQRVLDVGCGEGKFLDLAQARGLSTWGIEISPRAARVARAAGHGVFEGSAMEPLARGEDGFDVVTMWDILEHLHAPGLALRHLLGVLRPGGSLCIVTPMMDSVYDRVGRIEHAISGGRRFRLLSMCFSRDHVFRYNRTGLAIALQDIGFTDVTVTPRTMLSLQSSAYAGGELIRPWTGLKGIDRLISRAGVSVAKLARFHNKLLVRARAPRRAAARE